MEEILTLKQDGNDYRCVHSIVSYFLGARAYSEITAEMLQKAGFIRERAERVLKVLEANEFLNNKDGKRPAAYKAAEKLSGRETGEVWKELLSSVKKSGPVGTLKEGRENTHLNSTEESAMAQPKNEHLDDKGDDVIKHRGRRKNAYDKVKEIIFESTKDGRETTVVEIVGRTGLSQACVGSHGRTMAKQKLVKQDKSIRPHIWKAFTQELESGAKGDGHNFNVDGKAEISHERGVKSSDLSRFVHGLTLVADGQSEIAGGQSKINKGIEILREFAPWSRK